jgi:GNAT superfamily N-acetyltransferase
MTIRPCTPEDVEAMCAVVNDGASAYRGHIPPDRLKEPYMPAEELEDEIAAGVRFFACVEDGEILGVMGIQDVQDVTLIRHAYVRTALRGRGVGSRLLTELRETTTRPVLMGTWAAATWAVRFYQKHGYRLVSTADKEQLLRTYWTIPERQVETSVVLADQKAFAALNLTPA